MLIFLQFSIGITDYIGLYIVTSSTHRPFCFHNFVFLLNCLFVLCNAHLISVCVIAVSKSHAFLFFVESSSTFFIFSTTSDTTVEIN